MSIGGDVFMMCDGEGLLESSWNESACVPLFPPPPQRHDLLGELDGSVHDMRLLARADGWRRACVRDLCPSCAEAYRRNVHPRVADGADERETE